MKRRRVMIVEDESLVAADLDQCLQQFGYEVVGIADTAESARALAHDHGPDLALLDIRLKGVRDGIDVAEHLRSREIGFVYLTSHADQATLERAQRTEPLGYVLKPFDPREVHPVLEMAFCRHAADVQHRRMERWLATTLRSIGDGVVVTDVAGRVTYLNPVAELLTGWTRREALGEPAAVVLRFTGEGDDGPIDVAQRALTAGTTVHLDGAFVLQARDGRRVPVDDCAAPIRDEDGATSGAVIVFRDASPRLRVQQQQREADRRLEEAERLRSLGVLAGGLAHDLNNVLTAILGNVGLAREAPPGTRDRPLDEIEAQVASAASICRKLLAGAGAGPLVTESVDLQPVIDGCVQRERALARAGIGFSRSDEAPSLRVVADRVQLGQVFANLLRNAVEALGDRNGNIVVRSGAVRLPDERFAVQLPAGEYAWFEVVDDGPGMPADVRARVFEPFFTTKFTGRGLGLASVHGIVRRHGGCIHVESEPGRGTRFRVLWPAVPAPESPAGGDGGAAATSPHPIAVVDDDPAVRRVTSRLLHSRGFGCLELESGAALLGALESGRPIDGVVLDAMMPGMTGTEALQELRRRWPDLPVVMVSGHVDLTELLALRDPHLDYLAKPFTIEALLMRLQRLMRGRPST